MRVFPCTTLTVFYIVVKAHSALCEVRTNSINYLDSSHNGQTHRPVREGVPEDKKLSDREL
jgi:hypothetical protein